MCFFDSSPPTPPPPAPPPPAPPAPGATAQGFSIMDMFGVNPISGQKFRRRQGTQRFKIPISGLNLPT